MNDFAKIITTNAGGVAPGQVGRILQYMKSGAIIEVDYTPASPDMKHEVAGVYFSEGEYELLPEDESTTYRDKHIEVLARTFLQLLQNQPPRVRERIIALVKEKLNLNPPPNE